jgi:hypothetical protein
VLYGLLRLTTGSLLAPILASVGSGIFAFLLVSLATVPGLAPGEDVHTPAWILLASAAPVAVGIWLAVRWREDRDSPEGSGAEESE